MAQPSTISQQLMTGALLHFQQGVPIDDLALRTEHRKRLARVEHVYWQWIRNPLLDTFNMFKQLIKGQYANIHSEWRAAQKDKILFDFIVESVTVGSRKQDEIKVRWAADQMMRIGAETDNVAALDKGSKRLYEVAGLDKPEDNKADINKVVFLPSVVVTNVKEVDDTKENIDDEETRRIAAKYGAYIDEKRTMIEDQVAQMEARSEAKEQKNEHEE